MKQRGFEQRERSSQLGIMIALHSLWGPALLAEALVFPTSLPESLIVVAVTVFIAAQALRGWVLWSLGHHWNVSVMSSAADSPSFVSSGPYRFIRHPNYLVVILEFATLPLVGCAPWTALAFSVGNAAILFFRIRLEEEFLSSVPGYDAAMGHKARFIPLVFS
jgi:methyltransferase